MLHSVSLRQEEGDIFRRMEPVAIVALLSMSQIVA